MLHGVTLDHPRVLALMEADPHLGGMQAINTVRNQLTVEDRIRRAVPERRFNSRSIKT